MEEEMSDDASSSHHRKEAGDHRKVCYRLNASM